MNKLIALSLSVAIILPQSLGADSCEGDHSHEGSDHGAATQTAPDYSQDPINKELVKVIESWDKLYMPMVEHGVKAKDRLNSKASVALEFSVALKDQAAQTFKITADVKKHAGMARADFKGDVGEFIIASDKDHVKVIVPLLNSYGVQSLAPEDTGLPEGVQVNFGPMAGLAQLNAGSSSEEIMSALRTLIDGLKIKIATHDFKTMDGVQLAFSDLDLEGQKYRVVTATPVAGSDKKGQIQLYLESGSYVPRILKMDINDHGSLTKAEGQISYNNEKLPTKLTMTVDSHPVGQDPITFNIVGDFKMGPTADYWLPNTSTCAVDVSNARGNIRFAFDCHTDKTEFTPEDVSYDIPSTMTEVPFAQAFQSLGIAAMGKLMMFVSQIQMMFPSPGPAGGSDFGADGDF